MAQPCKRFKEAAEPQARIVCCPVYSEIFSSTRCSSDCRGCRSEPAVRVLQVGQAQQTGTGQKKRSALGDVTNSAVAAAQLPQKVSNARKLLRRLNI